jgi:hypothetical protein
MVHLLLHYNESSDVGDSYGRTSGILLLESRNREDVNWRSEVVDSNIQLITEEHLIPMAIAAYRSHRLVVNRLLKDGLNINCTSDVSCKLLLLAPVH